ncbi:MAG: ATP-binding protein [Planctomycetes bacterium]|nr:ATP-binding protein [Planctomycetota bacterium]
MISRAAADRLRTALGEFPAVALLGPRQCGKTTLALEVAQATDRPVTVLDLERDSDLARLQEAELYLATQRGRLCVVDEVQLRPNLFPLVRAEIDLRIRAGERAGQFLFLGSASRDLLQQSAESLAGRIAYRELTPFTLSELASDARALDRLWSRGGFPLSYLARDEGASWRWRNEFIESYLQRDLPRLGLRLPKELLRRFWSLLAHGQGTMLNAARLATNLSISGQTVRRYVDLLTELFLVRQLEPWSGASAKRLVKSPKVYVRDSGILHRLVNLPDLDSLVGHPICGASWEGFVIEQILAELDEDWRASYYRSSGGAEIDLVLEGPRGRVLAIEIKRTASPKLSRGFVEGCADVQPTERWFVTPGGDSFPLGSGARACPLAQFLQELRSRS